jgi:hypothetical protein
VKFMLKMLPVHGVRRFVAAQSDAWPVTPLRYGSMHGVVVLIPCLTGIGEDE